MSYNKGRIVNSQTSVPVDMLEHFIQYPLSAGKLGGVSSKPFWSITHPYVLAMR